MKGEKDMEKQGNIKISSENMMPIIKKWLYSDKDIFIREIVANGVDAITKHKKLVDMGEAQKDENPYKIVVTVDEKAKTLTVEDNGIGMTAEEVEKYITQIAFSGAEDFLKKYENASGDGIIGHFGLGFYSAYMVSENVEIYTKSRKMGIGRKFHVYHLRNGKIRPRNEDRNAYRKRRKGFPQRKHRSRIAPQVLFVYAFRYLSEPERRRERQTHQ